MSHNVLKLSKPSSQPSINPVISSHSLFHPNHLSMDFPKERESVSHFKDSQSHSASQTNIKKLAGLLNPRKERGLTLQDIHSSTSPNHTSPKSYLEISSKMNKLRVSTSTHENQNMNLISPKDLVRLAMSKHKSKASLKKVTSPIPTAVPRNFRKSLSLRFGNGSLGADKRDVPSKLITNSAMDENSGLSRTSVASKDRNAKMRRMKLIYNDLNSAELARMTRSTMYTPINDISGRYLQDSTTLNKSNSGYLLPASPVLLTNTSHSKSKHHQAAGHGKEEKGDKGHNKVGSGEQMGTFLKEYKPSIRDSKKKDKKSAQSRKMPSMENIKTTSHSFSRLMSHPTLNLGDKTRSPITDFKGLLEEDETASGELLVQSEKNKGKDAKPREEFIADLKNWVNDIVKPAEETVPVQPPPQKKNTAAAEKVKEAQEGLLEKLRDALENDEYVRREDYERLYREKESIEDELDGFKEENAKLREIVWRLQEELEVRKHKEKELVKNSLPMNVSMSDHGDELMEMIMKQQEEIEAYKKRENVVSDLMKMIWKAGAQIGDLGYVQEANEGEEHEYDYQDHYDQTNKHYGNGHVVHQNQEFQNQKHYKSSSNKHVKHPKHAYPTATEKSYKDESLVEENIFNQDQVGGIQYKEASSRVVKALSELGDSETDSSEQTAILEGLPMNPQSNTGFPLKNERNLLKQSIHTSSTNKLKIDMDGLGEKIVAAKKRHPTPSYKTIEKINNFIENGQNVGFHEEFMSKLDEFSPSWRQAALANKKY